LLFGLIKGEQMVVNQINLFIPELRKLEFVNSIMKQAPYGDLITTHLLGHQPVIGLFNLVFPQIYYSCLEKADGKSKNLYVDPNMRDFIIKEICNDIENSNYDVMYGVAEELAQEELERKNFSDRIEAETNLLNETQVQFNKLMEYYNEWDSHVSKNNSTLAHCVDEMITIADNSVVYPLVDKLIKRYTHLPYDINVDIKKQSILEVKW
jgi:hypothetical protein